MIRVEKKRARRRMMYRLMVAGYFFLWLIALVLFVGIVIVEDVVWTAWSKNRLAVLQPQVMEVVRGGDDDGCIFDALLWKR